MIVARVGEQLGCEYVEVRRRPSRASRSMFGVGAPTATPPPYVPRSPQPTSSMMNTRMLGRRPFFFSKAASFSCAADSCAACTMTGSRFFATSTTGWISASSAATAGPMGSRASAASAGRPAERRNFIVNYL